MMLDMVMKNLKGTIFNKYKQFVDNCFKILPRQALHAKTLGFIHQLTREKMRFNSDLPHDMIHVLKNGEIILKLFNFKL